MAVVKIDSGNFQEIIKSDKTVLLDFYADWCGPCKMLAPIIEKVAEENPQYVIGKINVDTSPQIASEYRVSGIPTLVIMKNGEKVTKKTGFHSEAEILKLLEV